MSNAYQSAREQYAAISGYAASDLTAIYASK